MPNRDEKVAESVARKHQVSGRRVAGLHALPRRGNLRRLLIALVVALATILTSVPVTTVAQQNDDPSNGSDLNVTFQKLDPTDAEVAGGFTLARLDTRKVSVKGLPPGVYDLVLQGDAEGNFRVHAVELGTNTVYEDIAKPILVETPTGKELNIGLGDCEGQDLRPIRICVTVTTTIRVYGYPIQVSVTVCFNVNID